MVQQIVETRQHDHSPASLRRPDSLPTAMAPRLTVSKSTEIELRYFIPPEQVAEITSGREFSRIEQHYIERKDVPDLVERFELDGRVDSANDFTVARLRRIETPSGSVSYFLCFKGQKEQLEGSRIARREFQVPLAPRVFSTLRIGATAGSLVKRRYDIQGQALCDPPTPLVLQVDVVEQAGRPLRELSKMFCTADIEINAPSLIAVIRSGQHTFHFLKDCIELSGTSHNISNRKIGRRGLDSRQRGTVDRFLAKTLSAPRLSHQDER